MLERKLEMLVAVLTRGCRFAVIAIMTWLTVVLVASVCARALLHDSLAWVDETSALLLVWLMLAVAPLGFDENFHIKVDLVAEFAPRWLRIVSTIFVNAAIIFFFAMTGIFGTLSTIDELDTPLFSLPIARAWATWVLPVSSAIIVLIGLRNLVQLRRIAA